MRAVLAGWAKAKLTECREVQSIQSIPGKEGKNGKQETRNAGLINLVEGRLYVPKGEGCLRLGHTCGDCDNMDRFKTNSYGQHWCGKMDQWVSAGDSACYNLSYR